jgi:TPR repeat protein
MDVTQPLLDGDACAQRAEALRAGGRRRAFRVVAAWRCGAILQHPLCMHNLGIACMRGYGMERDPAQAIEWLTRAAHAGRGGAAFALAHAYASGAGCRQDFGVAWRFAWDAVSKGCQAAYDFAMRLQGGGAWVAPPAMAEGRFTSDLMREADAGDAAAATAVGMRRLFGHCDCRADPDKAISHLTAGHFGGNGVASALMAAIARRAGAAWLARSFAGAAAQRGVCVADPPLEPPAPADTPWIPIPAYPAAQWNATGPLGVK